MGWTKQQKDYFYKQFNISESKFRESRLTWEELENIADHYEPKRNEHQNTVKQYAEKIQECDKVHSLRYRVKETDHLLEKIIRKNSDYLKKGDSLSVTNYEKNITDLMGIRALLLFKEDWIQVHDYLMNLYADSLDEEPFVHICPGDDRSLYEGKIRIKEDKSYRSAHYVIRTDTGLGIEIQVRTLYEEAWSEIDHKLRYPYNITNKMLAEYVGIMNKLTGMGDEMGSFINGYVRNFQENLFSGVTDDNEVYQFILDKIEGCNDEEIKQAIVCKIKQAENYRETQKMLDLIRDFLKYD